MDDDQLQELFEKFGDVVSSRVLKDRRTGQSKCVGFVHFLEKQSATAAIETMNGTTGPRGTLLQVRHVDETSTFLPEETNKLFVRHVPRGMDAAELLKYFSTFGRVLECTVHVDCSAKGIAEGTDQQMAYVTFATVEEATKAVPQTNNHIPWPHLTHSKLLVKPAETLQCRNLRQRKCQQQLQGADGKEVRTETASTSPSSAGPSASAGSPHSAFNQSTVVASMPEAPAGEMLSPGWAMMPGQCVQPCVAPHPYMFPPPAQTSYPQQPIVYVIAPQQQYPGMQQPVVVPNNPNLPCGNNIYAPFPQSLCVGAPSSAPYLPVLNAPSQMMNVAQVPKPLETQANTFIMQPSFVNTRYIAPRNSLSE